jgi:hypothetical protein
MSTAMVLVASNKPTGQIKNCNGLYDVKDVVHQTDRGSRYSVIHAGTEIGDHLLGHSRAPRPEAMVPT